MGTWPKANQMRRALSLLAARLGLGVALAAMLVPSAHAETLAGDAQIAIVRPLSFIEVDHLDFGSIIPSNTTSTVTLTPLGVRTATGGAVLVGNDHQSARFAGMGTVLQRVRIRITPNNITLTGPGPAMTVDNWTIDPQGTLLQLGASPNYIILPLNGVFWFRVGGRLTVGANQPAGQYTGTFNATLDYL
jgi:spore coat protein U-like protein